MVVSGKANQKTTTRFLTVVDDSGMYGSTFCQECQRAEKKDEVFRKGDKCPGCGRLIEEVERLDPDGCWYPYGGSDF